MPGRNLARGWEPAMTNLVKVICQIKVSPRTVSPSQEPVKNLYFLISCRSKTCSRPGGFRLKAAIRWETARRTVVAYCRLLKQLMS